MLKHIELYFCFSRARVGTWARWGSYRSSDRLHPKREACAWRKSESFKMVPNLVPTWSKNGPDMVPNGPNIVPNMVPTCQQMAKHGQNMVPQTPLACGSYSSCARPAHRRANGSRTWVRCACQSGKGWCAAPKGTSESTIRAGAPTSASARESGRLPPERTHKEGDMLARNIKSRLEGRGLEVRCTRLVRYAWDLANLEAPRFEGRSSRVSRLFEGPGSEVRGSRL